jgi:hypothetical protein
MTKEELPEVRQEILDYLAKHPGATDSLQGVATWWLKGHRSSGELKELMMALQALTKEGRITRTKLADGLVSYKLAKK